MPLKKFWCKLSHYGIHGYFLESLLPGRSQQVAVNDEYGDPTAVISGVHRVQYAVLYYSFVTLT